MESCTGRCQNCVSSRHFVFCTVVGVRYWAGQLQLAVTRKEAGYGSREASVDWVCLDIKVIECHSHCHHRHHQQNIYSSLNTRPRQDLPCVSSSPIGSKRTGKWMFLVFPSLAAFICPAGPLRRACPFLILGADGQTGREQRDQGAGVRAAGWASWWTKEQDMGERGRKREGETTRKVWDLEEGDGVRSRGHGEQSAGWGGGEEKTVRCVAAVCTSRPFKLLKGDGLSLRVPFC